MLNFFANELAGLRGGRFTLFGVAMSALDYLLFWHDRSFRGRALKAAGDHCRGY
jgi:hypothetical protein